MIHNHEYYTRSKIRNYHDIHIKLYDILYYIIMKLIIINYIMITYHDIPSKLIFYNDPYY